MLPANAVGRRRHARDGQVRAKQDLRRRFDVVLAPLLHVREELQLPVPPEVAGVEHGDAARSRQVEVVARTELVCVEWQRLELHLVDSIRNGVGRAGDGEVDVCAVAAEERDRRQRAGARARGGCGGWCGDDAEYRDLGSDYFTRYDNPDARKRRLIRDLRALGYDVTVQPAA